MTEAEFETRALAVLRMLAESDASPSVRAISDKLGMSRSTTHRILQALTRSGYVHQSGDGRYSVGPRLIQLSARVLSASPGADLIEAQMRALVNEVNETAYLTMYVPSDQAATFIRRVDCSKPLRYVQALGTQRSLHAGAAGKAILAALPDKELHGIDLKRYTENTITDVETLRREVAKIRERGFATSVQEHVEGAAGVAAAITSGETVYGSLALTVPVGRIPDPGLESLGPTVRYYAEQISQIVAVTGTAVL